MDYSLSLEVLKFMKASGIIVGLRAIGILHKILLLPSIIHIMLTNLYDFRWLLVDMKNHEKFVVEMMI